MTGHPKKCRCGCCKGTEVTTPGAIDNRPGLEAISYRIGEHGSFLDSMKARLSSRDFPALGGLTARTGDDPSIALLDGWATVADVLTFYQERLANEGYLVTATESRSVRELARLVGYEPRPGVASTVYLAYTVDENAEGTAEIPAGAQVQSVPGPGELPQTFETSEKIEARKEWNGIKPRLLRPQTVQTLLEGSDEVPGPRVYLKGTATNLKPNDALLIQYGMETLQLARVKTVTADDKADRTLVTWALWQASDAILISGQTQVRRARARVSKALSAAGSALAAKVLGIASQFLEWLYQESIADPVADEVAPVLRRPKLVLQILEPFDELVGVASSASSEARLAARVKALAPQIRGISETIEEFTEIDGGGPIGQRTDAVAEALDQAATQGGSGSAEASQDRKLASIMGAIVAGLARPRSMPPRDSQSLERDPAVLFETNSDVGVQAVSALMPELRTTLPVAAANAQVAGENPIHVYALRQRALLFAAAAPRKVTNVNPDSGVATSEEWTDGDVIAAEREDAVFLDTAYEKLKPESWLVLDFSAVDMTQLGRIRLSVTGGEPFLVARVGAVIPKLARAEYGISGQGSQATLATAGGQPLKWMTSTGSPPTEHAGTPAFQLIRRASVYLESEQLELAEEPIEEEVCGGDQWIETDRLASGLKTGRWLIVAGERSDIAGTSGVQSAELVMLDGVRQYLEKRKTLFAARSESASSQEPEPETVFLPGDSLHTYVKLARPLNYCYKRDTVIIYANVVKATHGETRTEVLGSGDASAALQTFALKQPPLTFVPAPEPDGVASTLRVYVNNVEWHEEIALVASGAADRVFITRNDDAAVTRVTFGNGKTGARLPTGIENVRAVYRNGIGKGGNVKAGQISQLSTRPLGIKSVINPLAASGGANRETRDQARRNAPLTVKALDRVVSTQDYADFARTFAGIGKAAADSLVAGGVELVYLTIAGAEDIPIDKTGDLYINLLAALREFGDPYQPIQVELRELLMLALSAKVEIDPDYLWNDVVDRARAALLDRFSFERRELGQSVALSEVISTIHSVKGVAWADVDALGAVSQLNPDGELRSPQEIQEALQKVVASAQEKGRAPAYVPVKGIRVEKGKAHPAQVAFFVPEIPDTLILNRIEG